MPRFGRNKVSEEQTNQEDKWRRKEPPTSLPSKTACSFAVAFPASRSQHWFPFRDTQSTGFFTEPDHFNLPGSVLKYNSIKDLTLEVASNQNQIRNRTNSQHGGAKNFNQSLVGFKGGLEIIIPGTISSVRDGPINFSSRDYSLHSSGTRCLAPALSNRAPELVRVKRGWLTSRLRSSCLGRTSSSAG